MPNFKSLLTISILGLMILLTGCAQATRLANGRALVFVYGHSEVAEIFDDEPETINHIVKINDMEIGKCPSDNSIFEIEVPIGDHRVSVEAVKRDSEARAQESENHSSGATTEESQNYSSEAKTEESQNYSFKAQFGKEYYIRCKVIFSENGAIILELEEVSADEGRRATKDPAYQTKFNL